MLVSEKSASLAIPRLHSRCHGESQKPRLHGALVANNSWK
jgi:hypothetical protein